MQKQLIYYRREWYDYRNQYKVVGYHAWHGVMAGWKEHSPAELTDLCECEMLGTLLGTNK